MEDLIKSILAKKIIPTKIYKSKLGRKFTIELETSKPMGLVSLYYRTLQERDEAFKLLDDKTFATLTFNPHEINILNLDISF